MNINKMHQVLVKLELRPVRIGCFNYIADPNAECYLVAGKYFYVYGISAHTSFGFSFAKFLCHEKLKN